MKELIEKLQLERHVEGGYFKEVYKSTDKVITLNERYNSQDLTDENKESDNTQDQKIERSAGSSIYFLLGEEDFSAWHQLNSDEIWHYYDGGSPVDIYLLDQYGNLTIQTLGNPLVSEGASFQIVINAGYWFAAEVRNKSSFALMGCTVSPGFEYCDFTLANREKLVSQYPDHAVLINKFTRDSLGTEISIAYSSSLSFLTPISTKKDGNNTLEQQHETCSYHT